LITGVSGILDRPPSRATTLVIGEARANKKSRRDGLAPAFCLV
jgi:hypothetical protein